MYEKKMPRWTNSQKVQKTNGVYSYIKGYPTVIDFETADHATTRIMRFDYPQHNSIRLEKLLHLLPEPGHHLTSTEANLLVWTYRRFLLKYIPITYIAKEVHLDRRTVSTAIEHPFMGKPSTILAIANWLLREIAGI